MSLRCGGLRRGLRRALGRGLSGSDGSGDYRLRQTELTAVGLRREAIRVAMTAAVEEATTLTPDRLEVPDGVIVATRPRVTLQITHSAVCTPHVAHKSNTGVQKNSDFHSADVLNM